LPDICCRQFEELEGWHMGDWKLPKDKKGSGRKKNKNTLLS